MASPTIVPSNFPVFVASTTALEAEQHRGQRRRQRKGAGRPLQTLGSTCDLVVLGKAGHPGCEIYANGSLRDGDRQQTSVSPTGNGFR
jgi:hypothetical protein